MAKAKKKGEKDLLKWKKKKWFQIYAPRMFNDALLGETTVMSGEQLKGKVVQTSLMNLTGDMKRQNYFIKFEVFGSKEGRALAMPISYKMSSSSIKRIIRRKRDRIDDSFNSITKDDVVVLFKPMLVTRNNTNNSVLTVLRLEARRYIARYAMQRPYEALFMDIINNRLQSDIYKGLRNLYPLKIVEMKFFGIERKKSREARLRKLAESAAAQRERPQASVPASAPQKKAEESPAAAPEGAGSAAQKPRPARPDSRKKDKPADGIAPKSPKQES